MALSIKEQIESLRKEIRHHDHLYYVLDIPELTDQQYDGLYTQLRKLEQEHPDLVTPDSPTQRVGGKPLEGFNSVEHSVPMLSIDNTYSPDELRQFDQRVKKALPDQDIQYVVEAKIDGVAMSLRYEKGVLLQGATRGDGVRGDDVTANVRTITSLPLRLESDSLPDVLEVRGEVFMPNKEFARINTEREETDEMPFANPRNATAGSLKMLDSRKVAQRKLKILTYALGEVKPDDFADSHAGMLEKLKKLSLPVSPFFEVANDIEEVIEFCDQWDTKRHKMEYAVDGMVIKVNSIAQQKQLGRTSRAPRWCIAYKFAAEQAETIVQSISVQVGKTGALTPVANFKPVQLAGTTVSRASLHNFDELARKDVRQGDAVLVEKAGEIIPQVVEVIIAKRPKDSAEFPVPVECPECGGGVVKDENGVYIRCNNPLCPRQFIEKLRHFAARKQMDIDGLGISLVEQLVISGKVRSFADLYRLKTEDVAEMERMGEKSAKNLIEGIQASKDRPLDRVLAALGILHVGKRAAQVMASEMGSIEAILAANAEQLEQIDEVGPVIAQSIYEFCHEESTRALIDDLIQVGVKMPGPGKKAEISDQDGILAGKTVVVTGSIEGYSRGDMEALIQENGGRPTGSVSKKTDLLIYGQKAGSKLTKAEKLGVETMTAEDFFQTVTPAS